MSSIQTIDFGTYDGLHKMMKDPNFNFNSVKKLDFSDSKHTDTPPGKALDLLPNLRVLILSKNSIARFNVCGFIKGTPFLQELDLSYNNINVLDDVIELGSLQNLRSLNLKENPVVKNFLRIKLIEALLFPAKYKLYNPVKILTATYNYIPNKSELDPKSEEESKKFYRMMEQGEDEFQCTKVSRLSKYDHKATLIKLSLQACPVPRKTRFPMLTLLNEEIISIQEVQSILMTEDLSEVIVKKEISRNSESPKAEKHNEKLHKHYLQRYITKKERKKAAQKGYRKIPGAAGSNQDELNEIMERNGLRGEIDYQDEIWKKPIDFKYKDAEFTISMADYKKMLKEYQENKKNKQAKQNGNNDDGEESEGDPEFRRIFSRKHKSKARPKLKMDVKYTVEQDTSDTEVEEMQDEDEKEDWSESDFLVEEDTQLDNLDNEEDKGSTSPQNMSNTSMSPQNMRRLIRQMTSMRRVFSSNEKKGDKINVGSNMKEVQEENNNDEMTHKANSLLFGSILKEKGQRMGVGNFALAVQKTETSNRSQDQRDLHKVLPKRGRMILKEASEPNLSISAYGRSKERPKQSVEKIQTRNIEKTPTKNTEKDERTKKSPDEKKEIKVKEEKKIEVETNLTITMIGKSPDGNRDLSPLPVLHNDERVSEETKDDNESKSFLDEDKEDQNKYKLDKFGTSFDADDFQPDQNPQTDYEAFVLKQRSKVKTRKNLQAVRTTTVSNQTANQSIQLLLTNRRAIDLLITKDAKSLDTGISPRSESQYTMNKHIQTFKNTEPETNTNIQEKPQDQAKLPANKESSQTPEQEHKDQSTKESQNIDQTSKIEKVNKRDKKQASIRKRARIGWDHQRQGLSNSHSSKNFKITTSISVLDAKPSDHFTSQTSKASQLIHIRPMKTENNQTLGISNYQTLSGIQSLSGFMGSMSELHSPGVNASPNRGSHLRWKDEIKNEASSSNTMSIETSPAMKSLKDRVKESRFAQTPKPGRARNDDSNSIIVQDNLVLGPGVAQRTQVEELIPGPKDGVSEALKLRILNNKGAKYNKLLETAQMLDETEHIIQESKELGDKIRWQCLKKPKVETVEPRIVRYDDLTEFLRLFNNGKALAFTDNKTIRELADLVNDFSKVEEGTMNKLDMEVKLREMREEALKLEGAALEAKYTEIRRLNQFLELLENLEDFKDNLRNVKLVDKLQEKEIKRAEHNAILAMHYMRLKKHYGQDYLNKFMNDDLRTMNHGDDDGMGGAEIRNPNTRTLQARSFAKVRKESMENKNRNIGERKEKSADGHKPNRRENLLQYIKQVKDEKNKLLREYPYQKKEPVYTDDKHRWLNVSLVKKYEPKQILKIEELMEQKRRRMIAENNKKKSNALTAEEKAIRHAQEFKEGFKQKKVLKSKVEKYIKEGTRNLDELLESENTGIEARFDKKQMFGEYMKLLWSKKL